MTPRGCGARYFRAVADLDTIETAELKAFLLQNPIVLQRPLFLRDNELVIARSPEQVAGLLGN